MIPLHFISFYVDISILFKTPVSILVKKKIFLPTLGVLGTPRGPGVPKGSLSKRASIHVCNDTMDHAVAWSASIGVPASNQNKYGDVSINFFRNLGTCFPLFSPNGPIPCQTLTPKSRQGFLLMN